MMKCFAGCLAATGTPGLITFPPLPPLHTHRHTHVLTHTQTHTHTHCASPPGCATQHKRRMWRTVRRCLSSARLIPRGFVLLRQSRSGRLGFQTRCTRHTLTACSSPAPTAGPTVQQALILHQDRQLRIQWEDGSVSLYPFVWLRDNCQCAQCVLQSAKARSLHFSQLDINTQMNQVHLTAPDRILVLWPDQHTSEFSSDWLRRRCFSQPARQALQEELFLNERFYWGSELRIPTADFQQVLEDDGAALAWLSALRRVGIVYLRGAPVQKGQVAKLSQRIGYLRMTFYGPTWQVQDKPSANNVAYTSGSLSLHTDYPALHNPPGVQFLHCLCQAKSGGESEVVDGFHTANQLRDKNPEAFQTLSKFRVDFTDTGTDFCDFAVQSKNHIIAVDSKGQVVRINYNNATRDSVLDIPLDQVQPFYSALKAYVDLMSCPENVVTYRMEAGDLVTFDNWRLLHGRRSYLSHPHALRHLEGAYLDWDEVLSRLRILRKAVQGSS